MPPETFPSPASTSSNATPAGYVDGVSRIAVLRANGLGDLMFAMPALEALKRTYPNAELVLLGTRLHQQLLEGRPGPVDAVIPVPEGVLGSDHGPEVDPEAANPFFERMQTHRFDIAVQIHGGGRHSNPFILSLGAGLTIGLKAPESPQLDRWVPYVYLQREVLRYLEVVRLVGATTPFVEPRLEVTERDLGEAKKGVPSELRPLAVLHPGASTNRRRWPSERFAAVGDELARAGARVAVIGSGPEEPVVRAVIEAMRHEAMDLYGKLSLPGLAGLLSKAAVVVANDSGPLHLAAAVGAPTVGVYWCGNMVNGGPMTQALHRAAVSWQLNCPVCDAPCLEDRCAHEESFVTTVGIEEVLAPTLELLGMERALLTGNAQGARES